MKKSIFSNLETKGTQIKLQQHTSKAITTAKRGRPRRPNMIKRLIKVDKVLYQQLRQKAEQEHTSIAHLLSVAIKDLLHAGKMN